MCSADTDLPCQLWAAYDQIQVKSGVAQSCPTLCDPMDCSLSGSSIHGIFQARVLEWIAISFSRGSSWPRNRTQVSRIAGRRFTFWATREALIIRLVPEKNDLLSDLSHYYLGILVITLNCIHISTGNFPGPGWTLWGPLHYWMGACLQDLAARGEEKSLHLPLLKMVWGPCLSVCP